MKDDLERMAEKVQVVRNMLHTVVNKACATVEIRQASAACAKWSVPVSATFLRLVAASEAEEKFMLEEFPLGLRAFATAPLAQEALLAFVEDYVLRLWRKLGAGDFEVDKRSSDPGTAELLYKCLTACVTYSKSFADALSPLFEIVEDLALFKVALRPESADAADVQVAASLVADLIANGLEKGSETALRSELAKGKNAAASLHRLETIAERTEGVARTEKAEKEFKSHLDTMKQHLMESDGKRASEVEAGSFDDAKERAQQIMKDLPKASAISFAPHFSCCRCMETAKRFELLGSASAFQLRVPSRISNIYCICCILSYYNTESLFNSSQCVVDSIDTINRTRGGEEGQQAAHAGRR